jgi:malate dehydrogenase (oxaloacetate-decarboxylating)
MDGRRPCQGDDRPRQDRLALAGRRGYTRRLTRVELRGRDLLANRYRNKATAFTDEERDRLGLHGLLPPAVEDLETQLMRARVEYDAKKGDLDRHIFLRLLQQRNTVLFYRFLSDNLAELLPIVYTPTVGLACQEWSRIYRREHGLYLSLADRGRVATLLENATHGADDVEIVVVTDGERILGLGDLGVGGMGISIGKLALYSAVGGVNPATTLPIALDVGTNNESLLSDPLYLGRRHRRVRGDDYDALIDELVGALQTRFPGVLLQWEDFAQRNAGRLLARHRQRICSFNDDIQGTAAVTAAAVIAGMKIADEPISSLRTVIVGAGSAGVGIANQLVSTLVMNGTPAEQARSQSWLVDRDGLLHDGLPELAGFQQPYVRPMAALDGWERDGEGRIPLLEVVRRVRPHALIGVTGQPGLFTEDVVRAMGDGVVRPIVMPLSNPTPRAECLPADAVAWTGGRALLGTGSPFDDVDFGAASYEIAQVNNVYVFPGLGLGVIASGATEVTDGMITAASLAVADEASRVSALMPPIDQSQRVARAVALAIARQAVIDGVASVADDGTLADRIDATFWYPHY